MATRFFRGSNDEHVAVDEILAPFLEREGGKTSIGAMVTYIGEQLATGIIRMDPSPDALRDMAIEAKVVGWSASATEDGAARFYADRHSGRFDRRTGRIAAVLQDERKRYIDSIRQSMMVEMPAAYRSQARLWAEIDPGLNAEVLSTACTTLIGEAIERGVKDARKGGKEKKEAA